MGDITMTKAQSGIQANWGLVITVIIAVVVAALLFIFIGPKVFPTKFSGTTSGFGKWFLDAISLK
jgi:hypothetical protein